MEFAAALWVVPVLLISLVGVLTGDVQGAADAVTALTTGFVISLWLIALAWLFRLSRRIYDYDYASRRFA